MLAVYGPVLTLLIFPLFRLYRSWRGETFLMEIKALAQAWLAVLAAFNAIILLLANGQQLQALLPYGLFQVRFFWVWSLGCLVVLAVSRLGLRLFFRFLRWRGLNQRRLVIVGAGELGQRAALRISQTPWLGIQVVGFFDDERERDAEVAVGGGRRCQVLGRVSDCLPYVRAGKTDQVVIALPMREEEKICDLIWHIGTNGVQVYLIPDLFVYGLHRASISNLGEIPIMTFNLFPLWKRLFDLVFSSLVLVVFAPLLAMIALLVKLEDGGPVFYGHRRISESGRTFYCLKFRTMHVRAEERLREILRQYPARRQEWEATFKLKDDPRITRIGRFLRRTSLDELPQFLNVLRGEMSVVGARPIVDEELRRFYQEVAITYCAMKPGITGPWQVGKRSDTEDYRERVELDRRYIIQASPWLDIKIILQTVFRIFFAKGAY